MITIPGRIPITIHPLFFLVAAFIGWMAAGEWQGMLIWMGVIFVSVLFHEMGHAYTAIAFGQTAKISLLGLGGLTERKGHQLKLWQEFLVVLNGPCFGFLLCLFAIQIKTWVGEPAPPYVDVGLFAAIFINLVWSLMNLLPVGPLDGGRLLSIVLEGLLGSKGVKLSLMIGMVLGLALGLFGFVVRQHFLGALFLLLAFDTYRMFQSTRQMTDEDRSEEIQLAFQFAEQAYSRGDTLEAIEKFQQVRYAARRGIIYNAATEYMARILSEQGEFEEAYDLLLPMETSLSPEGLRLLHRLAYYSREMAVVVRVGDRCYELDPSYDTAFINALAHALMGKAKSAVGWLQCANREGMPDLREGLSKREFDAIREDSAFREFLRSLEG